VADEGRDESPLRFSVRTIGPEPTGATPIEDEDLEGLIPDFVATRADLNQVEFENITRALPWAIEQTQSFGPHAILQYSFLMDLHKAMFADVWKWAGTQRRRVTNIGVDPAQISTQVRLLFDDARYWHDNETFAPDELAARIHCRLVATHPFPNGNGRSTRAMADLYLISNDLEPFTWGGREIDYEGASRKQYIDALVHALESDDYEEIMRFARGVGLD